jgi:hypothetical protein
MENEEWWEGEEEEGADPYEEDTRAALIGHFEGHRREVFYLKQLEVIYERIKRLAGGAPFHWVTRRALYKLVKDGEIVGSERIESKGGIEVRLFFHKSHRYWRRQAAKLLKIIDEMADPEVARGCGNHAEMLFLVALASRGFQPYGRDLREYRDRVWEETEHELDFILEKDGIAWGCEVKNTWDYIPEDELSIKLRICRYLGVRPLFIMRESPKSYNYEIYQAGGFALIFEDHLYPFGMAGLAEKIRKELRMPAHSPRAIPSGHIDRFVNWYGRQRQLGIVK